MRYLHLYSGQRPLYATPMENTKTVLVNRGMTWHTGTQIGRRFSQTRPTKRRKPTQPVDISGTSVISVLLPNISLVLPAHRV